MKVTVINECGDLESMIGTGLSFGLTSSMDTEDIEDINNLRIRLKTIEDKLANKQGGHNKFLEHIMLWLDVTASRGW